MKNVLMIGPDLDVRGGVSTVEKIILSNKETLGEFNVLFLPSHRDYNKMGKLLFGIISYVRFLVIIITERIEVIYIHMGSDASFYRKSLFIIISRLLHKKIIIHMHNGYFIRFYDNSNKVIKKFIKHICSKASNIIVLSQGWKAFYETFIPADKIRVIQNSVELIEPNPYKNEEKFILFMGKLDEKKGIYDLFNVIPDIIVKFSEIKLVLAGDGDTKKIKQYVNNLGISDYLDFTGWVGSVEKHKLFSQTGIFVLPSYAEGLPMSVIEAMAYGIPVITTDVGGLPEVIENGVDGIIIKPGDRDALRDNILKLLNNADYRRKLSNNGYNRIGKEFNSKLFMEKISGVLKGLY